MSEFHTIKNKYRIRVARKKAVDYTDKLENFLSAIIGILAAIGVLRALLQSLT